MRARAVAEIVLTSAIIVVYRAIDGGRYDERQRVASYESKVQESSKKTFTALECMYKHKYWQAGVMQILYPEVVEGQFDHGVLVCIISTARHDVASRG
jgi:hypothetical protein